jgi:EAL and modified HD-GYP domain-containing signal transduction protein
LRPDFLLLHQGAAAMPALLTRVTRRPPEFAGLPMLLTDIASLDDFEAAISQGMDYLCGALGTSAPSTTPGRAATLPPEVQRIGQLMNRLATGAETPVIVSEIKGDVSLSYALLRRLSSASYAQIDTGGSIDKAVLMLGRRELHRWLSMLLLQFAPRRKVSKALQEVALWRSRLFELMAQHAGESDPGQLFTLGLASMLGPILNIDASRVVDTLNLPPPARAALLTQDGPWGVYLQVATRLASGHSDGEGTAAAPFGGMTALQVIAEEAWVWAARHVDTGT